MQKHQLALFSRTHYARNVLTRYVATFISELIVLMTDFGSSSFKLQASSSNFGTESRSELRALRLRLLLVSLTFKT